MSADNDTRGGKYALTNVELAKGVKLASLVKLMNLVEPACTMYIVHTENSKRVRIVKVMQWDQ